MRELLIHGPRIGRPSPARAFVRRFCSIALIALSVALAAGCSGAHAVEGSDINVTTDLRYGTGGGVGLYLDAYVSNDRNLRPGVIIIHGGGWNSGDKSTARDNALRLVANGFVAFSINYRLAPRYPFPAALDDSLAAVAWVRRNADRFGVDPDSIGVVGGSAGGHLAQLVGAYGKGPLDKGSRVAAVGSGSGPSNFLPMIDTSDIRVRTAVREFLGCTDNEVACRRTAQEASPITYVDPSDPPMVLTNGAEEFIPEEQAIQMANALDAAGVPNELLIHPGSGHGITERVWPSVIAFLRQQLLGLAPSATPTIQPSESPTGVPSSRPTDRTVAAPRRESNSADVAFLAALLIGVAGFSAGLVVAMALMRRRQDKAQD